MLESMEYSQQYTSHETYTTSSTTTPQGSSAMIRKKKNKNTRRFSDEQIKSLESMFESESRLEPRKKLQLARELGLQPRQVAIWFQNKRARWKSKQLEREFNKLEASYNCLASKYEAVKKEKQTLLIQLQKLNDLIQMPILEQSKQSCSQVKEAISMDSESENGGRMTCEAEVKPSPSMERSAEHAHGVLSDDDTSIKVEYFGLEDEPGLLNFADHADGSLTSPEDWSAFESNDLLLLGQSTSDDYQWWDFWS